MKYYAIAGWLFNDYVTHREVGGSQQFSWCCMTENNGGELFLMKDRIVTVKKNHKAIFFRIVTRSGFLSLTHLFLMHPFSTPENISKPHVTIK